MLVHQRFMCRVLSVILARAIVVQLCVNVYVDFCGESHWEKPISSAYAVFASSHIFWPDSDNHNCFAVDAEQFSCAKCSSSHLRIHFYLFYFFDFRARNPNIARYRRTTCWLTLFAWRIDSAKSTLNELIEKFREFAHWMDVSFWNVVHTTRFGCVQMWLLRWVRPDGFAKIENYWMMFRSVAWAHAVCYHIENRTLVSSTL